jgi:adenosylmethionine-8-amino-7-oxononanoate aminotransferase
MPPTFDFMTSSLAERDKKVIWHPYTPQKYAPEPIPIIKGEGVWLIDEKGNKFIDAISSWWVNAHGHGHPYIAKRLYEQALQLEQVIFAGFTHEPAVLLAERLMQLLPGRFEKVFYSDNGSTATEVAVKMALQYWRNKGQKRTRVLALRDGYHGDTFGAMSFSERGIFNKAFLEQLFEVKFVRLTERGEPVIEDLNNQQAHELLNECACIIYEPLIQGAAGMIMHSPASLDSLLTMCKQHDVLCIADEVMTGFGRAGTMFASSLLNNLPDIICLSKALTGGTMALGVTACTKEVHDAFATDDPTKTFYHGHSYTANPLACTAALASLDIFEKPDTFENIRKIVAMHAAFAATLCDRSTELHITDVRQTGTILAFNIKTRDQGYTSSIKETITRKLLKHGVYLRPLGNVVYIMPPYCISEDELKLVFTSVIAVLEELARTKPAE